MIIFKFAIIDLRKSYCDKNELIIKFISEINSAMIKQLAGAAGAARRVAFPAAKSPRQARPGSPAGQTRVIAIILLRGPSSPHRRESSSVAGAEGQSGRRGLRPRAEAGCPPPRPPGSPVAQRRRAGVPPTPAV